MEDLQRLLLLIVAFVSLIPLIHLQKLKASRDFKNLRIVTMLVFVWSMNMIIKYLVENTFIIYLMFLMVYPLIFLTIVYFMKTVFHYFNIRLPKGIEYSLFFYVVLIAIFAFSNDVHGLFLAISYQPTLVLDDILYASPEPLYFIHLVMSYGLLLFIFSAVLFKYVKTKDKERMKQPVMIFSLTLLVGVILNIFHIFVYTLYIDPTYISVVLFMLVIYHVIYRKDLFFAILEEGRSSIVKNMREYYVLTAENGRVIEVSDRFKEKFPIAQYRSIQGLLKELRKHAKLYEDLDLLDDKNLDIPYLYMEKREFSLPKLQDKGHLYLFYNETKMIELIELLESLKNTDVMTDIYNRNYLENSVANFEESYPEFGLMLVDLNGLKLINDNFGHNAGDDRINELVSKLKDLKQEDESLRLIRSGGDEFLVFIPKATREMLNSLKESLIAACDHEDILKTISVSIGLALRKTPDESFEKVFRRADRALYVMKDNTSRNYQAALNRALKQKQAS